MDLDRVLRSRMHLPRWIFFEPLGVLPDARGCAWGWQMDRLRELPWEPLGRDRSLRQWGDTTCDQVLHSGIYRGWYRFTHRSVWIFVCRRGPGRGRLGKTRDFLADLN